MLENEFDDKISFMEVLIMKRSIQLNWHNTRAKKLFPHVNFVETSNCTIPW